MVTFILRVAAIVTAIAIAVAIGSATGSMSTLLMLKMFGFL